MEKWITYYQKYKKTYIIQSEEQYNSIIQEGSHYVTVLWPSRLMNQKGEKRCNLNNIELSSGNWFEYLFCSHISSS